VGLLAGTCTTSLAFVVSDAFPDGSKARAIRIYTGIYNPNGNTNALLRLPLQWEPCSTVSSACAFISLSSGKSHYMYMSLYPYTLTLHVHVVVSLYAHITCTCRCIPIRSLTVHCRVPPVYWEASFSSDSFVTCRLSALKSASSAVRGIALGSTGNHNTIRVQ